MSGGQYDYAFSEVQNFADAMLESHADWCSPVEEYTSKPPANLDVRKRFAKHLYKVAKVMRSIEWCDSGDTGEEDCLKDMLEFLKEVKG
jgi:hypothetical protein